MAFWTYILLCADGLYYTGHTDDLEKRIGQHQSGMIKGFTSSRLPARLMWSQDFPTRYEALDAELKIKKWSKAKKAALIRGDWDAVSFFARPPKERNSPPVRVERSRDTPKDSANPMGLSTALETNGLLDNKNLTPVRVERSRDTAQRNDVFPTLTPFASSEVERPIGSKPTPGVSTSLDTNGTIGKE